MGKRVVFLDDVNGDPIRRPGSVGATARERDSDNGVLGDGVIGARGGRKRVDADNVEEARDVEEGLDVREGGLVGGFVVDYGSTRGLGGALEGGGL